MQFVYVCYSSIFRELSLGLVSPSSFAVGGIVCIGPGIPPAVGYPASVTFGLIPYIFDMFMNP